MDGAAVFRRVAATANKAVLPLLGSGVGQRLLGRSMATLSYRGRRSGTEIVLPVNYRRDASGGGITVAVMAPDAKRWWRNFTGAGSAVQVRAGDDEWTGHAIATRSDSGAVRVHIARV